eukprot:c5107_g1_i1 orf=157-540(+)
MMELSGPNHQLLVSHLAEVSHPSFGSMMALMTTDQDLEAGRSTHDLQQGAAQTSHYMYYSDPYQAAVYHSHLSGPDHSQLSGPDQLSYDLVVAAVDAQTAAETRSCSQLDHDDRPHEQEEDQKVHVQ